MTLSDKAKQIKEKAMKALKDLFTSDELVILQAELAASVTPPATPAATDVPKEFKTADGVSIFVTGADADGNIVPTTSKAFSDATVLVAMTDGEYVLDNGNSITVAGGIVTEVENKAAAATEPDPMAEMKTQLSAHTKALDASYAVKLTVITKELETIKTTNKVLLATIDKILNAPIKSTPNTGVEKDPKDYTNNEKVRADRGEKIYK